MSKTENSLVSPLDEGVIAQVLDELSKARFLPRLRQKDASLWSKDPEVQGQIEQRLGWLDAPERALTLLPHLREQLGTKALDGFQDLLFLGMGGSSVFARILEANPGLHQTQGLRLTVLDSLIPDQVHQALPLMAAPTTLIVVASKSGTTVETMVLAQIAENQGAASRMIACTDPGSPLEGRAQEKGYLEIFLSWPDVGGRFGPFTVFGLVPAYLVGMDVERLLTDAKEFRAHCRAQEELSEHPAALGVAIGACIRSGEDVLKLPESGITGNLVPLLEQLLAESIGKDGQGLWPVFHASGSVLSLKDTGNPTLGGEIYRWQIVTATIGAVLGINPFDEPDVGLAKNIARKAFEGLQNGEGLPWPTPSRQDDDWTLYGASGLTEFFEKSQEHNEILSLLLYLPVHSDSEAQAKKLCGVLSKETGASVAVGFGPRYLHATGQLHKGGNNRARHLIVTCENSQDFQLEDGPLLSELALAQALADVQALQQRNRTVAHLHLKSPALDALDVLTVILNGKA